MFKNIQRISLLTLLSLGLVMGLASAQGGISGFLNYHQTVDNGDNFQVSTYFNLVDGSGNVLSDFETERAVLNFPQNPNIPPVEAQPFRPDSLFYITLVLDASGSMSGAQGTMRAAAAEAVQNAPEGAQFSVVRFNERANIQTIQEFTSDQNLVINAINEVRAQNGMGTCLYDATYHAIQEMGAQPPGRRAVIVFTDGKDETASGTVCSQQTVGEVIALANQTATRLPIYTIGMQGSGSGGTQIETEILSDMAQQTGGISVIGTQADLGNLFESIMIALRSQWLAQFYLACAPAGTQTVNVTPYMDNGTTATNPPMQFTIEIPREFPCRPDGGGLELLGVRESDTLGQREVDARMRGADQLAYIDLRLLNSSSGIEYSANPQAPGVFGGANLGQPIVNFILPIPISDLAPGEYTLLAEPYNSDGDVIRPDDVNNYETPQLTIVIESPIAEIRGVQLLPNTLLYQANVYMEREEQMDYFEVSLKDETNIDVPNWTNRRLDISRELRLEGFEPEEGKDYILNLTAYNSDDRILASHEYNFTPPLPPTPYDIDSIDRIDSDGKQITVNLTSISTDPAAVAELDFAFLLEAEIEHEQTFDTNGEILENVTLNLADSDLKRGTEYNLRLIPRNTEGKGFTAVIVPYTHPSCNLICQIQGILSNPISWLCFGMMIVTTGSTLFIYRKRQEEARNPKPIVDVDHMARMQQTIMDFSPSFGMTPEERNNTTWGADGVRVDDLAPPRPSQAGPPQRKNETVIDNLSDDIGFRVPVPSPAPSNNKNAYVSVIRSDTSVQELSHMYTNFQNGRFVFSQNQFSIGRQKTCDLSFFNDASVSSQHVVLRYDAAQRTYIVTDTSTNGTRVDGNLLRKGQSHPITPGRPIEMQIGPTVTLQVEVER